MDLVILNLLACPRCGGKLLYDQQGNQLVCRQEDLIFLIQDGVPLMKLDSVMSSLDGVD